MPHGVADPQVLRTLEDEVADAFLQAAGVTRADVEPYLAVVRAARVGECPDEPRAGGPVGG